MNQMLKDTIDPLVREAIENRLDPTELVELLDISIEDLVDVFYENILDKLTEIKEHLGFDMDEEFETDT